MIVAEEDNIPMVNHAQCNPCCHYANGKLDQELVLTQYLYDICLKPAPFISSSKMQFGLVSL